MSLKGDLNDMIYKKRKKAIHFKDAPIIISKEMIANYIGKHYRTVHRNLQFNKDTWNNFWLLVQYLESKGLRPERSEG